MISGKGAGDGGEEGERGRRWDRGREYNYIIGEVGGNFGEDDPGGRARVLGSMAYDARSGQLRWKETAMMTN